MAARVVCGLDVTAEWVTLGRGEGGPVVKKFTPGEWAETVSEVLAQQPELAAVTVQAMQEGILASNDRLRDRVADVSMGLVEALNTKPGQVRRRRPVIVCAIEASTVRGSKWADEMIAKEQA